MLDEARKREKVANAFLAATMALSAAQSPKDFVKTGKIESPGVALMQRWGRVRGEAERNLDSGAVVPRNKKMKTFKEFVEEVKKYTNTRSKADAEKLRQSREDPSLYRLKNRQTSQTPLWGLELRSKRKGQQERRTASLRPITHKELEDHAKRNFYPSPAKLARRALRIERARKRAQKDEVQTQTQKTGKDHNVDHIVPQPDKRSEENRSRFQAIHPGDASDNRKVEGARENREKNSKNTRTTLTRAAVVRRALGRAT